MSKKTKVIALIPARGGSKGIKNKNLLKIKKYSLVEIAIKNAVKTKQIDEIYISSDSKKILNKSSIFPNVIKHIRSKKSSNDKSTSRDVLEDFLSNKKNYNIQGSILVYLQPSSPMKNAYHIDKAIKIFQKLKKNTLISCYKIKDNEKYFKSFFRDKKNNLVPIFKNNAIYSNRQTLSEILIPNGAIFIFRVNKYFLKKYINYNNSIAYIMKKDEVIDINTLKDYKKAKKNLNS